MNPIHILIGLFLGASPFIAGAIVAVCKAAKIADEEMARAFKTIGINKETLRTRLQNWTLEDAMTKPPKGT